MAAAAFGIVAGSTMTSVVASNDGERKKAAPRSAIMTVGVAVWPPGMCGKTEESHTRTPLTPMTRRSGVTTASLPVPILHVPVRALAVWTVSLMYSAICLSVFTAGPGKTSSPKYSPHLGWFPSLRPSLMPSMSVWRSASLERYPASMQGRTWVLEELRRTEPCDLARQATLWNEYPSGWFLLLRNWVKVVIPSGERARAARKRICKSGCPVEDAVRTKAPWSHPVEVSNPLLNRNHFKTGKGLVIPKRRSKDVTLTPFFLVLKETTAAGWSCKFCPTLGLSCTTGIPNSARCLLGPIPLHMSSCGDAMAPPVTKTSPPFFNLALNCVHVSSPIKS
mmetsp:Transcript_16364/g.45649  ORF Transcript_16364/g.45649 Transcript_16364/m.45649 type:complete len:336 (+) Transcript_16364:353-1360(+)